MRVKKKVINIGDSKGIILDKLVLETMDIGLGDEVVIDIVRRIKKNG